MRYLKALMSHPGEFEGDDYVVRYVEPYEGRATDHIDVELRAQVANGLATRLSAHVVTDRSTSDVLYLIDDVRP